MGAKVAILGIYHETNTFIDEVLRLEDFNCARGKEIRTLFADAYHEIGGIYEVFDREDIEVAEIIFADATPGGKVSAQAYHTLLNELLLKLKENLPVDGCMLIAHGAAVSESIDDMDGHWFSCVRDIVGWNIPLVATLDPHANVSAMMVENTDVIVVYKTNPHIDQRETGNRAAALIVDILNGKKDPVQYLTELPLAISIEQQCTYLEPCKSVYALAQLLTEQYGALCTNIFLGFPYADVAKMGSSLVVVADKNISDATIIAEKMKEEICRDLDAFSGRKITPTDAVMRSIAAQKPVLFLDMGDNIGGGSPGNSTALLRLLNENRGSHFFICLYDPASVKEAEKYKPGDFFTITIDEFDNAADNYTCEVILIRTGDGKFSEDKPVHGGKTHFDMGRIAVVKTAGNGIILLTSLRMLPFSLKQLTQFDIQPGAFDIIVAKGVNAPLAAYSEVCPAVIQVDTPGVTQADVTRFAYRKRRNPMFPFEPVNACYAAIT